MPRRTSASVTMPDEEEIHDLVATHGATVKHPVEVIIPVSLAHWSPFAIISVTPTMEETGKCRLQREGLWVKRLGRC